MSEFVYILDKFGIEGVLAMILLVGVVLMYKTRVGQQDLKKHYNEETTEILRRIESQLDKLDTIITNTEVIKVRLNGQKKY